MIKEADKSMNKKQMGSDGCGSCSAYNAHHMVRLGVNMKNWDHVVALAGNPNVGKSTVFNSLTGLRQHTGNWPGKTVSRAEGGFAYGESRFKLVDLPGTYSLLSTSPDEEIARDFILFGRPDVTVIVVDATRLERNLNLVLQILEITNRAVICLNLIDEATRHGIQIDSRTLARDLGVPVVPTSARFDKGIDDLLKNVYEVATGRIKSKSYKIKSGSPALKKAVRQLAGDIESRFPGLPNVRWIALRLLEGDKALEEALVSGNLGSVAPAANIEADLNPIKSSPKPEEVLL